MITTEPAAGVVKICVRPPVVAVPFPVIAVTQVLMLISGFVRVKVYVAPAAVTRASVVTTDTCVDVDAAAAVDVAVDGVTSSSAYFVVFPDI